MRELQAEIIEELGVRPEIDAAQEIRRRVDFLKDYLAATGAKGFVLGISGGIDSTLAGRLAQLAVQEVREASGEARFISVRLPHGVQQDADDAAAAMDFIAADEQFEVNIAKPVAALDEAIADAGHPRISDFNRGNAKARTRMIVQYAIAGDRGMLVLGTDHAAESVTGFFTKFGDGGADLLPLAGLNKRQNQALLRELQAPELLWSKKPTADLLDGQPQRADEEELGLTYDQIDDYLEGREVAESAAEAIEKRFVASRHKRAVPATYWDQWWRS
ncbi:ammonia-dependent NAD(+) synthetase [Glutamicibacter halophytocola]|uniref:NH(3)-dependent NAD(+) synthetase n=1 Tax=Glutamicibacter halophytocola TaxID=1933880 RepID=A0AA94XYW5_9MICC|nr:ammonia-dependent NAD(+) synthetase [Glutamicibacter halophytocola]ALG27722.1 NAD synthetase [Glutamicibacter halophytocola]NQD41609.1 ammonia-dependent NAD(+) synthetase [Glutamicibacter halophytocola]UUX59272.1 ammonia-dependent NAD(+) synthetase [Glutamicibacter halophytocola]